jgi:hypothetical protein
MIVKANEELVVAARGLEPLLPTDVVPISSWDSHKLTKHQTRLEKDNSSLLDSLAEMIPDWMSRALMTGAVLVMDAEDFYELDEEIRTRLEIIRR